MNEPWNFAGFFDAYQRLAIQTVVSAAPPWIYFCARHPSVPRPLCIAVAFFLLYILGGREDRVPIPCGWELQLFREQQDLASVTHALVTSRLDICNAL